MFENDGADLFELIWFSIAPSRLKIQNLGYTLLREDMVVTTSPFDKTKALQEIAQLIEINARIRRASQDSIKDFSERRHTATLQ